MSHGSPSDRRSGLVAGSGRDVQGWAAGDRLDGGEQDDEVVGGLGLAVWSAPSGVGITRDSSVLTFVDRTILRALILLSFVVVMVMLAAALAVSQRDLSVVDCVDTGLNSYACSLKQP